MRVTRPETKAKLSQALKAHWRGISWERREEISQSMSKAATGVWDGLTAEQKVTRIKNFNSKNASRKLTLEQVREIRSSSLSCAALADEFGVSRPTVSNVKRRITYKDVT